MESRRLACVPAALALATGVAADPGKRCLVASGRVAEREFPCGASPDDVERDDPAREALMPTTRNDRRGNARGAGVALRILATALLVSLATPSTSASSLHAQCRRLCRSAITGCIETSHVKKRMCRKFILKR